MWGRIDIKKFYDLCAISFYFFLCYPLSSLFLILLVVSHLFIIIICCILTVGLLSTQRCIDIVFCILCSNIECMCQVRYFSYFNNFSLFIDFLTMEPFRFIIWLLLLFFFHCSISLSRIAHCWNKFTKWSIMVFKWSRKVYHGMETQWKCFCFFFYRFDRKISIKYICFNEHWLLGVTVR